MMRHSINCILTFFTFILFMAGGCRQTSPNADQVFYNGTVYTLDSAFTVTTAFAIKDEKIIATGTDEEILKYSSVLKTDLKGAFVYPGFQDAHCHFYGYGNNMKKIWLTGTKSYQSILDTLIKNKLQIINGWLIGRGWDQNDWAIKKYPNKSELDSLFPGIPVFLLRIDGHAAIANQMALDAAGITTSTIISGGEIEMKNGKLTGLLIDHAVDLMYRVIPEASTSEDVIALLSAQKNCFEVGLTSVTDAGVKNTGLSYRLVTIIDSLQKNGSLKMRINAMAALEELDIYRKKGKLKTDKLSVRSFKLYADGSLGSRGACLLKPYSDQPGHSGFLIHTPSALDSIIQSVVSTGFQLCTHCIGDSSHRIVLQLYDKYTNGIADHRWRIEHAQVINPDDISYYKKNHIIPSMQPVHATSDMYWAEQRIGSDRLKGAYALKLLMEQSGLIAAGSDFPVEHINPLFGFFAAVSRKDQKGFPEKGFLMENALTREQALRAMTIWAAYASFNEKETGSLEKGKFADFVILNSDLMKVTENQLWQIKVSETFINGEKVFQRGE